MAANATSVDGLPSPTQLGQFLDSLHAVWNIPVWMYMLCAFCACAADDVRDKYLLHFWLTMVMGFGGGLVSAVLLMHPEEVPVNMFSMQMDVMWTLTWWLMNYFPYGLPGRIARSPPVQFAMKLGFQVPRGITLCGRVSQTLKFYPGATIAAIAMGCLGGSGGKVVHDMIKLGYHIAKAPDEVSVPSMSLHSSFFSALLYYALVHVFGHFTQSQATSIVIIFMIFQALLMEILELNLMYPFVSVFHAVLNIPTPSGPKPLPGKKPAAAEPAKKSTSEPSKKTE